MNFLMNGMSKPKTELKTYLFNKKLSVFNCKKIILNRNKCMKGGIKNEQYEIG